MQSRLRLHLAARIAFLAFLFLPPPVHAQAAPTFPKSWNDAVSQLADNVAAAVSPSTPVTLDAKNISALDSSDTNRIIAAFQSKLQQHSLTVVPSGSSAGRSTVPLRLTFSESADAYLWVIQIFNNVRDPNSFSSGIVSVSKGNISANGIDQPSLSLDQRFVWKQSEKFLDFAIVKDSAVGDAALLILGTNRLAVYKLSGPEWVLVRENPISPAASPSRAPDGTIDTKAGDVYVAGLECRVGPSFTAELKCAPAEQSHARAKPVDVSGQPATLGTLLPGSCRDEMISLYTGAGDWTQPDVIQGYLMKSISLPMVPSGNPIQLDGPIISLQPDPESSSARVVVHNLKTGNYEAYIVTATCSH
jgi:hypothetical protein